MKTIQDAIEFFKPIFDLIPYQDIYIGGGVIREYFENDGKIKTKYTDYDIYFKSEKEAETLIKQWRNKYVCIKSNSVAILFQVDKYQIHIIKFKEFKSIEDIVSSMDFTVCSGVLSKSGDFHCHDKYFEHIKNKQLELNYDKCSRNMIFPRVIKYIRKGYQLSDKTVEEINNIIKNNTGTDNSYNKKSNNVIEEVARTYTPTFRMPAPLEELRSSWVIDPNLMRQTSSITFLDEPDNIERDPRNPANDNDFEEPLF